MKKGAIFYSYICKKLKEKKGYSIYGEPVVMKRKEFRYMLGRFAIPLYLQIKVINEMQNMGLIKIKDKKNIILIDKSKSGWFD